MLRIPSRIWNKLALFEENSPDKELKRRLQVLLEAVGKGVIKDVKDVVKWFEHDLVRNKQLLGDVYALGSKCVTQHDVIIKACEAKQSDILYYLLKGTHFLDYLIDPSISETEMHSLREKAIQHALRRNAFCMVEMLYDYWCGNLYWKGHDILKLEALEKLLKDVKQTVELIHIQDLAVNYHCLTKFNMFQQALYKSLPRVNSNDITYNEIATALVNVLDIYKDYSKLVCFRIPHDSDKEELKLRKNLEDRSSIYFKGCINIMYEVYLRKMAFNVSLLILENLYLLRKELNLFFNGTYEKGEEYKKNMKYTESYEEIENTIYHFIYRTNEDWRLYLSKDRKIRTEKNHVGLYNGRLISNVELTYDVEKVHKGPLLYLEHESFKISLDNLKIILTYYIDSLTTGTSTTHSLATGAPATNSLATGAPTTHSLTTGAPATYSLTTGASTTNSLAIGAPTTYSLATGASTTNSLATGAPTTHSLTTGASTTNSLATGAPTTHSLTTGASTTNSLAIGAPTTYSLATGASTTNSLATGASKKVNSLGNNYLKSTMYMNDHNSLQKIIDYIDAIESANGLSVLMIERTLQVIGEITKNTEKSYHISESTKSLLQIALSVETINQMHNIRNFLSKTNTHQVTTRTSTEYQDVQIFHNIVEDLKEIKKTFISVHEIYKCILDKSLLEKGLSLLEKRTKEWPCLPKSPSEIQTQYKKHKINLFSEDSDFVQRVWKPTGLTIQLLKEITHILENKDDISRKMQEIKETLTKNLVNMLPSNIQKIRKTLELIDENKNNVNLLNQQLEQTGFQKLTHHPKAANIDQQKQTFLNTKKIGNQQTKDNILKLLNVIKDYSVHWMSIKNMLKFCISNCELFALIRPRLELLDKTSVPDNDNLTNARNIIQEMEAVCLKHTPTTVLKLGDPSFSGIQAMNNIIPKVKKIKTTEDFETAKNKLLFFIDRVKSLQDLLEYSKNVPDVQLIKRFKQDKQFRMELEMLLADISNVLSKCEKQMRIMNKSTQLLTGIDLGDVLDHGNPFLEVLGGFFDSHELVKAYLSKAKEIADDRQAIEALYELFQLDVDLSTIENGDRKKMNDVQKMQYDLFLKSQNWKRYIVIFIPKKI